MTMTKQNGAKHDTAVVRHHDLFSRFFDDLPELFRRPVLVWPERGFEPFDVEEFTEGGTYVVRVELGGIDPEKDVEISIQNDVLHIGADRREEEKKEGRDYVRRELRYGSFHRDFPLAKGVAEADVKASYKDGMLEIRIPTPSAKLEAPKRVAIEHS